MLSTQKFCKFKLHTLLLRVTSYCNVNNIEDYITNIDGYKFEIKKITKQSTTDPNMCTFEDIVLNDANDKWKWRKFYFQYNING